MTDKEKAREARAAARAANLEQIPLLEEEEEIIAELQWLRVTNAAIQRRIRGALRAGRERGFSDRALGDLMGLDHRVVKRLIEEGEG